MALQRLALPRPGPRLLGGCLAAVAALGAPGCSDGARAGRVLHVSPRGSDGAPGTPRRPWRTLGRALRGARPGDTVVLGPGRYGRRGARVRIRRSGTRSRPIVLRGPLRGARPTILGHVRIDADHVRLRRVVLDGPTGRVVRPTRENPRGEEVEVWVRGRDVEIAECEIRDSAWHAGVFVTGRAVRLLRNHIHHNGDFGDPRQANLDHGIYWDAGSGVVANNLIEGNVAFGVHLYRAPAGVRVVHNTIVRNGRAGVIVSNRAAGNVIANNIVAFNARPSVAFDLRGAGNLLAGNLFWANGDGAFTATDGLAASDNVVADPGFVGKRDYRLRPQSPARGRALRRFSVPDDLVGHRRPRDEAADVGALEAP